MSTPELRAVGRLATRTRDYTAGRNAAIKRAHEVGHSLRQIAEAAGLSHSAIKKIVDS